MNGEGLTSEEVKRNFPNDVIERSRTFETMGVSREAASDYLLTSDGKKYLGRLIEADSSSSLETIKARAIGQIISGRELPRTEAIGINEPLVKIVPSGTLPSAHSPFWTKEAELEAAVNNGKNLSNHFGLPIVSEAPRYDIYRITPKVPTEVFVSAVAPTSELNGKVTKDGGAEQSLVPNRQLFNDPVYVRSVDNMRNLAVEVERGNVSPNAVRGAGAQGAVEQAKTVEASAPAHSAQYLAASATIQSITAAMESGDAQTLGKHGEAFTQSPRGQAIMAQANAIVQREEQQHAQQQAQRSPRDPREVGHPDHALNQSIRDQIQALHTRNGIVLTNKTLDHLTASVALNARENGLARVDQLRFNDDKSVISAEQKSSDLGVSHPLSKTNIQQAMQTPPEQAYQRMADETQRQTYVQQVTQQQAGQSRQGASQER